MYYTRKIDTFLTEWKNDPDHLPLIVKGARLRIPNLIQLFSTKTAFHYLNFKLHSSI